MSIKIRGNKKHKKLADSSIHLSKFIGKFTLLKKKMGVFFKTNFGIMLCIKYEFELPRKEEGEELKENKWTKKQWEEFMANNKAKFHLLSILSMQEINKIKIYHSTKEF